MFFLRYGNHTTRIIMKCNFKQWWSTIPQI